MCSPSGRRSRAVNAIFERRNERKQYGTGVRCLQVRPAGEAADERCLATTQSCAFLPELASTICHMTTDHHIDRLEMGITRADFLRIFPTLVVPSSIAIEDATISGALVNGVGARVSVTLSEPKVRTIASLVLSSLDLRLNFFGCTRMEAQEFMRRFDQSFHKGGG